MSMNDILQKIASLLEKRKNPLFSYDVSKQKMYIEKLGDPKSEIERSYFQYKCQMQLYGKGITLLLNIVSLPMIVIYWIKYGNLYPKNQLEQKNAVFFRDGKPENIMPQSLNYRYNTIETNPMEGLFINKYDKKFIRKIILKYPFSWHFILKCMIKIEKYSFAIEKYSPQAIIVCAEYSFTSSLLTYYCRQRNIKHINVMHGEKLYYMRDAFFEYDNCYVWDEYYKNLFISMKAYKNQFVIEVPPSLKINRKITEKKVYDYTYYLGAESEKTIKIIAKILEKLYGMGKKISIRPHPRYSNIDYIKRIFYFANIEDPKSVSIEQSLFQSAAVISLYSTVLNQALCNSIPIIIDNISNPEYFNKLKELEYICLGKKHELLSDILEENI